MILSKTIYGTELLALVKVDKKKKCFRWFICAASFSRNGEFERHPFWKDAAMSENQGSQGVKPFWTGTG